MNREAGGKGQTKGAVDSTKLHISHSEKRPSYVEKDNKGKTELRIPEAIIHWPNNSSPS